LKELNGQNALQSDLQKENAAFSGGIPI